MADLVEVCDALKVAVGDILYPSASTGVSPIATVLTSVTSGWPPAPDLTAALANGEAWVSIYPGRAARNVTRYAREWLELDRQAATYAVTAGDGTITVSGVAPTVYSRQNVAVFLDHAYYVVSTAAGQTSDDLAAAIGAEVSGEFPNSVVGSVITFDNPVIIGALRVGVVATVQREVKRQVRPFDVMIWAATPEIREKIASRLDVYLGLMDWLALPDGTAGRMIYRGDVIVDTEQLQGIFRRNLNFEIEYATTQSEEAYEIVAFTTNIRNPENDVIRTVTA